MQIGDVQNSYEAERARVAATIGEDRDLVARDVYSEVEYRKKNQMEG